MSSGGLLGTMRPCGWFVVAGGGFEAAGMPALRRVQAGPPNVVSEVNPLADAAS
jgi:hypothetical protein